MARRRLPTTDFSADPIHVVIKLGSQLVADFTYFFDDRIPNHSQSPQVLPACV
jgi:hypothetical protein